MLAINSGTSKADVRDAAHRDGETVAVIIPTFNQARFLAEAITSVLMQTRAADEIIVVDDGSTDDPAKVVAKFPSVRLVRQGNRGLSAARNTGLQDCTSSHVVFLDADDRLFPIALQAGLDFARTRPDCAFVYGAHRRISGNGNPFGPNLYAPVSGDAHLAFSYRNLVGVPSSILFRRDCLLAVGGFDETLRRLEDHDIYLRLAQRYPIASHPDVVAEYRKHRQSLSSNSVEQLRVALGVLDRHAARVGGDQKILAALRRGRKIKRRYYVSQMLASAVVRWRSRHNVAILVRDVAQAARWSPRVAVKILSRRAARALSIPKPLRKRGP